MSLRLRAKSSIVTACTDFVRRTDLAQTQTAPPKIRLALFSFVSAIALHYPDSNRPASGGHRNTGQDVCAGEQAKIASARRAGSEPAPNYAACGRLDLP
jgi:hypothetical protein